MLMSITISKPVAKKGGPYTKKEQEARRNEVFRLHFELGHSAVKIASFPSMVIISSEIISYEPSSITF